MPTPGLFSSLLVAIWIAFSLVDCSSLPRASFTREQQDMAGIPKSPTRESGRMIQQACRTLPLSAMGSASQRPLTFSHCQAVAPKAHSGLAC